MRLKAVKILVSELFSLPVTTLKEITSAVEAQNVGKTSISKKSDSKMDDFSASLQIFVLIYHKRKRFTPLEKEQLSDLFLKHANDQYRLGHGYASRLSNQNSPIDNVQIQKMAKDAEQAFLESLKDSDNKIGVIAGLTAALLGIKALNAGTVANAKRVRYATRRDGKVCPRCEAFDGKIYDVDKGRIEGPTIPDDLHPNCRCRYLVLD